MSIMTSQTDRIQAFIDRFSDVAIFPLDADYEALRNRWHALCGNYPMLIVCPTNREDRVKAMNFARQNDLLVAVQEDIDAPTSDALEADAVPALIEQLTEREMEVLSLVAQGYTNQEIADHLYVVIGTVKTHNHHIYGKLGVKNRVQAVA
ncbi:MAG: LuxR C-terminal-related transcriptional regulator, partial [Chloroflexota bacterium]